MRIDRARFRAANGHRFGEQLTCENGRCTQTWKKQQGWPTRCERRSGFWIEPVIEEIVLTDSQKEDFAFADACQRARREEWPVSTSPVMTTAKRWNITYSTAQRRVDRARYWRRKIALVNKLRRQRAREQR